MINALVRPLALFVGLAVVLAGCGPSNTTSAPPAQASAAQGSPAANGSPAAAGDCPTAQPPALAAGETRTVSIATAKGEILIHVEADLSPIAAGNFVALAECGWYDGVVFHRVVPDFVIQGGDGEHGRSPNVDPSLVGTGGPGYTIADEPVTALYARGIVAMARTRQPNSVGSQFFIILDDGARTSLASANTYQIIGAVATGMEAVDAITAAADAELPTEPVVMTDVSVSGN